MKSKIPRDPYLEVIQGFNRKGVRYVVVGMSGINFYARDASETFGTLDYDFFLDPLLSNIKKATGVLKTLGFSLSTSGGTLQSEKLTKLVRDRKTIIATTPYGLMIELLLAVSGYPFSELAKDARTFTTQGVPVRVGKLKKLLTSKRLAARPKDQAFLRRYEHLFEEPEKEESHESRTRSEEA